MDRALQAKKDSLLAAGELDREAVGKTNPAPEPVDVVVRRFVCCLSTLFDFGRTSENLPKLEEHLAQLRQKLQQDSLR